VTCITPLPGQRWYLDNGFAICRDSRSAMNGIAFHSGFTMLRN
jgi:hypothetical protein